MSLPSGLGACGGVTGGGAPREPTGDSVSSGLGTYPACLRGPTKGPTWEPCPGPWRWCGLTVSGGLGPPSGPRRNGLGTPVPLGPPQVHRRGPGLAPTASPGPSAGLRPDPGQRSGGWRAGSGQGRDTAPARKGEGKAVAPPDGLSSPSGSPKGLTRAPGPMQGTSLLCVPADRDYKRPAHPAWHRGKTQLRRVPGHFRVCGVSLSLPNLARSDHIDWGPGQADGAGRQGQAPGRQTLFPGPYSCGGG